MVEITIELPQDMHRLCRTCMSFLDTDVSLEQCLHIDLKPTDICKKLAELTNMKILPTDELPHALCSQCLKQLHQSYDFVEQCLKVENHLKEYVIEAESNHDAIMEDADIKISDQEDFSFLCLLCNETFDTYYSLSLHSVDHEINKTLVDKYLSMQTDERKINTGFTPIDKLNLVAERKIHIVDSETKSRFNPEFSSTYVFKSNINNVQSTTRKSVQKNIGNVVSYDTCSICNLAIDANLGMDSHICPEEIDHKLIEKLSADESMMLDPSDDGIYTCHICDRSFDNALTLSLHFVKHALLVESETDPKIFSQYIFCDVCGMHFESDDELNKHTNESHADTDPIIWECNKCSLIFEDEVHLLIHDREVGHSKEFFWDEFLNKEVTKDIFTCPMCEQSFISRELLNKHSVQHAIKRIRCRTCKAFFCTDAAYNAHLPSHPNYTHICTVCGKVLGSKSSLKSHVMGIHSTQKPYICPICGKSFKTPNRLHVHKLIHKKDKKFVCSYCGYSTNKGGDLTVHIRTHTEERPYKCTYVNCGRGFKTSSHLSEHIRRHLQIKKYKCNICNAVFGHHSTLKIHLMQHTGEKPYKCNLCHLNFRRKHHLKNHMKQHDTKQSK